MKLELICKECERREQRLWELAVAVAILIVCFVVYVEMRPVRAILPSARAQLCDAMFHKFKLDCNDQGTTNRTCNLAALAGLDCLRAFVVEELLGNDTSPDSRAAAGAVVH